MSLWFGQYEANSTIFPEVGPLFSHPHLYQRMSELVLEKTHFLAKSYKVLPKLTLLDYLLKHNLIMPLFCLKILLLR